MIYKKEFGLFIHPVIQLISPLGNYNKNDYSANCTNNYAWEKILLTVLFKIQKPDDY